MSKQDAKTRTVLLSNGDTLTIHAVPMSEILSIAPGAEPEKPTITMELATGQKQTRFAKEGEPEYEAWQKRLADWERDKRTLQNDVVLVLAMGDEYEFPEPIELPKGIQRLIDTGLRSPINNEWSLKATWLRCNLITTMDDQLEIDLALQEMSGTPKEAVQKIKDNFRNRFRGALPEGLGADVTEDLPA